MYSGTLIDDLIKTVERTERHVGVDDSQHQEMACWQAIPQNELAHYESSLAGVA